MSLSSLAGASQAVSAIRPGTLLGALPSWQRRLAQVVNFNEVRSTGLSTEKFAQATLACMLPKLLLSRSLNETAEIMLQEVLESTFFYYSVPLTATFAFAPLFRKLAPKSQQVSTPMLQKTFSQLLPHEIPKVLPLKAGIVLAAMAMIPLAYSVNFFTNLMTEKVFRHARFSDIVNLSRGRLKDEEVSPVAKKAVRRIKQCWGIAAGMMLGGTALATLGPRMRGITPLLKPAVKFFDFKYDGKLFGMTLTHLLPWWWINGYSYIDSARDKLEKVEVGIRALGITTPFLYPVTPILKGIFVRQFGNETPLLLKPNKPPDTLENRAVRSLFGEKAMRFMNLGDSVKSLHELEHDCMAAARKELSHPGVIHSTEVVYEHAQKLLQRHVRAKNFLYWTPLVTAVLGTGLSVGLLNRFYTALRYKRSLRAPQSERPYCKPIFQPNPSFQPPSPSTAYSRFSPSVYTS